MQAIWNHLKYSYRPRAAGVWAALLSVLTICLGATVASAQQPAIVVSQSTLVSTTCCFIAGNDPGGGNFAVTQGGDIAAGETYMGESPLINGVTGALIATISQVGSGLTVDSQNNLWGSSLYTPPGFLWKIPYVDGVYITAPVGFSDYCTGNASIDTSPCAVDLGSGESKSLLFDAKGDLFSLTVTNGSSGNSIYEIPAANLYSGSGGNTVSPAPTLIYTDPNPISAFAMDPWGNIYFTDAVYASGSNQTTATSSALKELPYTGSGTGYAGSPTVLVNDTTAPVGDQISGVTVGQNGTVYYEDYATGIFAIPSTQAAGPAVADAYQVSTQGGYALAMDGKGNLYTIATNYSVYRISLNNLVAPASPVGTPATAANVTIFDNVAASSPNLTYTGVAGGITSTEFSATNGTCTADSTAGSVFGVATGYYCTGTFTFTPTQVGERSAVLTVTDAVNSGSATLTASGIGQGAMLALDPGNSTPYTTGFTAPAAVAADVRGNIYVADSGANAVYEIVSGVPTAIGSGFRAPAGLAFDAGGNLYIADTGHNQIVEIPSISGALVPASQSTFVASTVTFNGTTLNSPQRMAVGPDGALYISDTGNNRVVTYDTGTGFASAGVRLSGLTAPAAGIAVDGSGDLYVAIPSLSQVLIYAGDPLIATLTAGLTTPTGVAVDPSGSVLITDPGIPGIVRVPDEAGVLTSADQVTVENLSANPGALATDAAGDLFVSDATAKAVYAVMRSAASINLGNVSPGTASPMVPIYVESAGNEGLNTPMISTEVAAPFTLEAGAVSPCGSGADGTTVAVGTLCEYEAQFSPTSSDSGPYSATSSLTLTDVPVSTSPNSSVGITLSGQAGTTVGTPTVPVDTPIISPSSGYYSSVPLEVSISDSTPPGSVIYYTTDGSTPTYPTTGTTTQKYSGPIAVSSTETIQAIATYTGYLNSAIASATYTIGPPQSFTLGLSEPSILIMNGQSGTVGVTITPVNGFNGQVTLTCSALPIGGTCSFSPASVTPSGTAASSSVLTITTNSTTATVRHNSNPLFPVSTLAVAFCCFLGFRKRRGLQMLLLLAVSAIGLSLFTGCSNGPRTTRYPVTILATSGAQQQSIDLTVIAENL